MSARHKLNQANLNGVLLIAGVIAFLFGSWEVFFLLVVLLAAIRRLAAYPPENKAGRAGNAPLVSSIQLVTVSRGPAIQGAKK